MTKFVLAISPDLNLLEQISAHLQEGGRFQVFSVPSGKEALTIAATHPINLAILDAEISDIPFIPLTRELVALIPGLKLLVYPPQNNPHHPVLNGVVAQGFLNKPFFGPEVNEKIIHALNDHELQSPPQSIANEIDLTRQWLEYPESGEKQIEQLLASTTASAGLLLMRGHVIAASGALAEETSQNIINFLNRYWSNIQAGELFRYLNMNNQTSTYLVYATPLFKNVAFALVYHNHASLPDIRNEVLNIREAFLNRYHNTGELQLDLELEQKQTVAPAAITAPQSNALVLPAQPPKEEFTRQLEPDILATDEESQSQTQEEDTTPIPAKVSLETEQPEILQTEESAPTESQANVTEEEPYSADEENEEPQTVLSEKELQSLDNLLAEMPVPDPESEEAVEAKVTANPIPAGEWQPLAETAENTSSRSDQRPHADIIPPQPPLNDLTGSEGTILEEPRIEQTQPMQINPYPDFDFKLPWEETNQGLNASSQSSAPPPLPTAPIQQTAEREPSHGLPIFEYHLLILPLHPQQFITHEIADLLNQDLPLLHDSCGWQCASISARPLYLQWSALLPASVSVCEMVQEIKARSNIQLFARFPGLLQNYPGGEFWAPGYFAISGSLPLSNRMVNDYISLSRQALPSQA